MSTASTAQVDAHRNGDCGSSCAICDIEDANAPRLFIDEDAYGDEHVWERIPAHPSAPQPVLACSDVGDEALWAAIVAMVDRGEVQ